MPKIELVGSVEPCRCPLGRRTTAPPVVLISTYAAVGFLSKEALSADAGHGS